MKKYTKPLLETEVLTDISESIFMGCSGKGYFTNVSASEKEHQPPQEGRYDCRFQVDGHFTGNFKWEGDVYIYLKFYQTVQVTQVSDYEEEAVIYNDDGTTLWIGKQTNIPLQNGNSIGFGDLYASVFPDPTENVMDPDVTFSFGYNASGCF